VFFDTPVYFLFLILTILVYWRLEWRRQNVFLLAASYFFYGWWDWRFLLLMISSTAIDFIIAKKIDDISDVAKRRLLLIASLVVNFSILGFFKYFNFFLGSTAHLLDALGVHNIPLGMLGILLPPGISFYTFQEVAYIVDVYGGKIKASRNFVDYGLFISLFPHLIAGPIQRPSHLLPQVQSPRTFQPTAFQDGCMLILMGLFRKCVIADNCALLANAAFAGKLGSDGWAVLIGVYAFAWQIYGDFSGYSDIARGSAQLLGFHFMVNFRQPYLAVGLQDFWRRWHISLSTWLRDYLYIPLGGNRGGEAKTYRNLLLTMLLGGLRHGANWTYVFWGAIQGVGLSLERAVFGHREQQTAPQRWLKWVRCHNVSDRLLGVDFLQSRVYFSCICDDQATQPFSVGTGLRCCVAVSCASRRNRVVDRFAVGELRKRIPLPKGIVAAALRWSCGGNDAADSLRRQRTACLYLLSVLIRIGGTIV
jgi:alginate O-acetyltransferase complex protein AlgI